MTLSLDEIEGRLELVLNWILHSGIMGEPGYFHCWYDLKSGSYPFVYTEMLGYGISTLLYFHEKTGDRSYLDKAVRTGEWLVDNLFFDGGALVWKFFFESQEMDGVQYAFDNGVCARALIDLSRISGDRKFLAPALRSINWVTNQMDKTDGSYRARYDPDTGVYDGSRWSHLPGSHHAKIGMGLIGAADSNDVYRARAEQLGDWVLSLQREDGRFLTNLGREETYVHAHCYAAEGLLYMGRELEVARFIDASRGACEWLTTIQKADGAVGRWYDPKSGLSSDDNVDALAQAVRLWLVSEDGGPDCHVYRSNIGKGIGHLLRYQSTSEDPRASGGFHYARLDGRMVPHINCCVSLFASQVLQMYLEWRKGSLGSGEYKWLV